jgi:hypothetical protein
MVTISQNDGLWSVPVMPGPACKQRIVCAFFQKRAIDLQAAVMHRLKSRMNGKERNTTCFVTSAGGHDSWLDWIRTTIYGVSTDAIILWTCEFDHRPVDQYALSLW